jgi:hypothetical protein
MIKAIGKFTVAAAGTPVRLTSQEATPNEYYPVHGILIQALPDNVGKVYIGNSTMNRAARTDLFGVLAIPTANSIPTYSAALTLSPNAIQLKDFYIDADTATDGVIVSVLIA